MKTPIVSAAVLFLAVGLLAAQAPVPDTRVIASTSEWSITAQQFEAILNSLPDQARTFFQSDPENKRRFLDDLIEMWVLATEAKTKGIDKETRLKTEVEFYSNNIIAREYTRQLSESVPVIADSAVQEFYSKNEIDYTQLKVAHILIVNNDNPEVRRENIPGALSAAEARKRIEEVRAKMRGGESFEELAKQFSQDPSSAPNGGDIGLIRKGQLVGEVDAAAFALVPGSFSDIVESPIGFHILRVTERRVAPLDEVRNDIKERLTREAHEGTVQNRVKAAGVKIDESFFKP